MEIENNPTSCDIATALQGALEWTDQLQEEFEDHEFSCFLHCTRGDYLSLYVNLDKPDYLNTILEAIKEAGRCESSLLFYFVLRVNLGETMEDMHQSTLLDLMGQVNDVIESFRYKMRCGWAVLPKLQSNMIERSCIIPEPKDGFVALVDALASK